MRDGEGKRCASDVEKRFTRGDMGVPSRPHQINGTVTAWKVPFGAGPRHSRRRGALVGLSVVSSATRKKLLPSQPRR